MADNTKIEWTDATWNPITGCSIVSPGCTNCYAMKLAGTRLQHHPSRVRLTKDSKAGPVWTGEVRFNPEWLTQPLTWKKPRMIFVCAHGDLFAEGVPDEWIDQVFAVMALAPHHTFQVLTKRTERMREYLYGDSARQRIAWAEAAKIMNIHAPRWRDEDIHGANRSLAISAGQEWPLPNVWLGVSVEDQARAEQRIPILLDTPAAIRWISAEPLLGPIYIPEYMPNKLWADLKSWKQNEIDWVVAGGESGRNARPMHPDWARSLRDQCAAAGVPFLFKQWGQWAPLQANDGEWPTDTPGFCRINRNGRRSDDGWPMQKVTKKASGRLLDGVEHNGFPEVRS